jgi:hypothetical protein
MNIASLKIQARQLRLSGLVANIEIRLQEATSHQIPHAQFLEMLFTDELNVRQSRNKPPSSTSQLPGPPQFRDI